MRKQIKCNISVSTSYKYEISQEYDNSVNMKSLNTTKLHSITTA